MARQGIEQSAADQRWPPDGQSHRGGTDQVVDIALEHGPVAASREDLHTVEEIDDTAGIILERARKQLEQIISLSPPEPANHPEIDRRDERAGPDQQIARVRIGVKEAVLQDAALPRRTRA
jgi:hypothetical protein